MVTFSEYEESRKSSGNNSRRSSKSRPNYDNKSRNKRYSSEKRYSRDSSHNYKSEVTMTKVICSSCGVECEVPFKPTSNKPIYCDSCFVNKGKATSNKISENDLDIINEKLNKIIKALNIE